MKLWKKSAMLSLILAGTLSISGFAFDLSKDATEWTSNPDCMVTMYLGMPQKEFENNFSGLTEWQYKRWDNMNVLYPCNDRDYTRIEQSPISKNLFQREMIHTSFREDTDALLSYQVTFEVFAKKLNTNYKKDVLPAFDQARKIYKTAMDNMIKKYGQPTYKGEPRKFFHSNGDIYIEDVRNTGIVGNERYSIYILLRNSKKDIPKPNDNPIASVLVSHSYKS